MIRVNHYVGISKYGLGLFIKQSIRKGLQVLDSDNRFTIIIHTNDLPSDVLNHLRNYAYNGKPPFDLPKGELYYNTDDSRFMNHSDNPSCLYSPKQEIYVASRDLVSGDELTCNYNDFCDRGEFCFSF